MQAQNLISESGQNLGIQIVATESLEPAQIHHTINEHGIVTTHKGDKQKCISCGTHLPNSKRKGPKLIRCESCIQNDSGGQNRPTQIYVSSDGDIKFEVDDNSQNVVQFQSKMGSKKKNVTTVTKCTSCNGTGVVIVTDTNTSSTSTTTLTVPSVKNSTRTSTSSSSPQKIQHVQVHSHHHHHHSSSPPPLQHAHPVQHHAPPQNQSAQSQNDKPFNCNICGGKFSRYSSLWSHKKLHSGEKNYRCELCNSSFAKAVYLKNHMRIHR